MRRKLTLCVLPVLWAILVAGAAFGQEMTPEEQQAMMAAMTPGEHHKHLSRFAGKFEYTSKIWMAPGAQAMESGGTSEASMVFGGRYLRDTVKGNFMGMPFEGWGWLGYDNVAAEYVIAWIDNMSTGIVYAKGQGTEDGKTITLTGSYMQPGTGTEVTFKEILRWVDEKHHVMEWHSPGPDGKMFKSMELNYTRVE